MFKRAHTHTHAHAHTHTHTHTTQQPGRELTQHCAAATDAAAAAAAEDARLDEWLQGNENFTRSGMQQPILCKDVQLGRRGMGGRGGTGGGESPEGGGGR